MSGLMVGRVKDEKGRQKGEGEGDETIRPHEFLAEPHFEGLLVGEFGYLVDDALMSGELFVDKVNKPKQVVKSGGVAESGLMTPPLTTPELGFDGESPVLLDRWPSPPRKKTKTFCLAHSVSLRLETVEGCRPFSTCSFVDPFKFASALSPHPSSRKVLVSSDSCPTSIWSHISYVDAKEEEQEEQDDKIEIAQASRTTISPISVLSRPRPLRASESSNSLFSSSSSGHRQKPSSSVSVLSRSRPIPSRAGDNHMFANKTIFPPAHSRKPNMSCQPKPTLNMSNSLSTTIIQFKAPKPAMPKSLSTTTIHIKVPQRKSSLDVRFEAERHRLGEKSDGWRRIVHPNSFSRDLELAKHFHSSVSPYLDSYPHRSRTETMGDGKLCMSAATAAKARRGRSQESCVATTKSCSLPVLFTARTPAQRAAGETGTNVSKRKCVVFVGPLKDQVEPPKQGVLVVHEETTTIGLAL